MVDLFEVRLPDPGENREGMPALGEEYADDLDRWFGFITKAKHLILDLSPSNGTSFLFSPAKTSISCQRINFLAALCHFFLVM